jgi:glycerophosphoryl diester phosphodiesterase
VSATFRPRYAFLDHPGPIPFAHRGGASDAPENTLPAFAHAISLGYRYLETDAQVTQDGVLLAFHDDELARTTGRPGRISQLPYREVAAARVSGTEPIPLMEDVIATWPDARVNVDAKSDAAVQPLNEVIRRTASLDRVCIGSFRGRRIRRARQALGAELCTSIGPVDTLRWRVASSVPGRPSDRWPMPSAPCAQVSVSYWGVPLVTARTVATAHAAGMQVHVWTIDDADEMRRLLDLGVDGIMTDRLAVLKEVLVERGQWF